MGPRMKRTALGLGLFLVTAPSAAFAADKFRDCPECPEMVAIPAGAFMMGSMPSETEALNLPQNLSDRERPQHRVAVPGFAASVYEVTVAQYRAFVDATGRPDTGNCNSRDAAGNRAVVPTATWRQPGFKQTEREPVV